LLVITSHRYISGSQYLPKSKL